MKINVRVNPNSECNCLDKIGEGKYSAKVKAPAEDNKANNELIKLLCKEFKVNFRKIKIKNPHSRQKVVEIELG